MLSLSEANQIYANSLEDTLYFLLSSATASAADIFLVKTFLTLVRHSASNFMFSILKLDSILLTFLSIVILVSISFLKY